MNEAYHEVARKVATQRDNQLAECIRTRLFGILPPLEELAGRLEEVPSKVDPSMKRIFLDGAPLCDRSDITFESADCTITVSWKFQSF